MSGTSGGSVLGASAPIAALVGVAVVLVTLAVGFDTGFGRILHPGDWMVALERDSALDRVANAAEVVAGVLAIAITVVAIVVELAANRYTHRITQLFIREPINSMVLGFFVLTTIVCLWVSAAPYAVDTAPRAALPLAMGMVTMCLLMLLPYFAFLFRFLSPRSVISLIRAQALTSIRDAGKPGAREEVVEALEELDDMARSARQHRDRSIAMAAVDALEGLLRDMLALRKTLPDSWFMLDRSLARDPDFVALEPGALREIESQRTWLETKVFRQYLSLFEECIGTDRDVGNLIALNTRSLARDHAVGHPALVDLAVRFFNSYMRFSIRHGDLRSAYYVQHQYRAMAEDLIRAGLTDRAREIAGYLRYYGQFAFETGQPFLLEVVAYDLAALVECAAEHAPKRVDELLDEFLEVDRESRSAEQELRLRGVRRAQVQLATFFLERGDEPRARRIHADLADELPQRLDAVRAELDTDQPEQYWEFTDRGINFAHLSAARRAFLDQFYGWFRN